MILNLEKCFVGMSFLVKVSVVSGKLALHGQFYQPLWQASDKSKGFKVQLN